MKKLRIPAVAQRRELSFYQEADSEPGTAKITTYYGWFIHVSHPFERREIAVMGMKQKDPLVHYVVCISNELERNGIKTNWLESSTIAALCWAISVPETNFEDKDVAQAILSYMFGKRYDNILQNCLVETREFFNS